MNPFFETAAGSGAARRLLLISYHFPPAQSAGALRWQKLARFAVEHGWNLDVLCLDPAELPSTDQRRLQELPPGTRVYGVPVREPLVGRLARGAWLLAGRLRSRAPQGGGTDRRVAREAADTRPDSLGRDEIRWDTRSPRTLIRAFFAWTDFMQYGGWARGAAARGAALARHTRYDAAVSCGPPHMAHEGGRLLARRLGVPFVMDLRDPWSLWQRLPEHYASPLWLAQARRFERRCVRDAALVVVNTEPLRRRMQALYPRHATRIIAVTNGYDEEDVLPVRDHSRFLVAYSGAVYIDRDPRPLFSAAARVIREHQLSPAEFGLEFMGEVQRFGGLTLEQAAEQVGIGAYVHVHPPRPRREALEFMAGASVLVILPQDSDLAIPSKLFEYTRYGAWILALAHRDSAIELLLRDTEADVVHQSDVDAIAAVLRGRYLQHRAGERPTALARSEPRLSRRAQASLLFTAIERCVGGSVPEPVRSGALTGGAHV